MKNFTTNIKNPYEFLYEYKKKDSEKSGFVPKYKIPSHDRRAVISGKNRPVFINVEKL